MDNIRELFRKKGFILLFSMIISSLFILLTKHFIIIPETRFELILVPILSLLWGPYAILGFIIAESIALLLKNPGAFISILFTDIIIFISNFAIWKLWYSIMNKYGEEVPNLGRTYSVIKFTIVCSVYSLITYSMYFLFINAQLLHLKLTINFIIHIPIIYLGLAIIIYFVNKYKIPMYTPKMQFKEILPENAYHLMIVLYAALLITIHFLTKDSYLTYLFEIISFLILIIYLLKPYDERVFKIKDYAKLNTFHKIIPSNFLLIITLFIFLTIIPLFIFEDVSKYMEIILPNILMQLLILIILMMIPTTVYSYILENQVTKPINELSKTISKNISTREEYLNLKEELESINVNNEIKTLIDSLIGMEKDLIEYEENLINVTSEKERYETELKLGSDIQYSMIPKDFEEFHNEFDETHENQYDFALRGEMKAAQKVGGDFYDYFKIDDETIGFAVGDVCGKGVTAALIMVKTMTLIQDYAKKYSDLSSVFREVNNLIHEDNAEELFVKALLGKVNLNTGELSFVNAGYEQPLIRFNRENDDYTEYVENYNDPLLSSIKDASYKTYTIKLDKGDGLFLYSDGIINTVNESKEPYGLERLKDTLNKHKNDEFSSIMEIIEKNLNEFSNHRKQNDDLTMFIIQLK